MQNFSFDQKHQFKKVKLEIKHCETSESGANIRIYVGNQKHPNLSTQTYGFSHVFENGADRGISWVRMRLNLKYRF